MNVIELKGNLSGFTVLKGKVPSGHCEECCHPHDEKQPHNRQTMHYQYGFREKHGRWPTWHDAMRHCPAEVKTFWLHALKEQGVDVGIDPVATGQSELAELLKQGVRALSVRQPYAWLIVNGHKPFENRDWSENNPGLLWLHGQLKQGPMTLLIHAAKAMTHDEYRQGALTAGDHHVTLPPRDQIDRGGIVGVVKVKQWHWKKPALPFAFGRGMEVIDVKPLPFTPCAGALGFFKPQLVAA